MELEIESEIIDTKRQQIAKCLFDSHVNAARNNRNLSSDTYFNTLNGSGNITQAIASAILTTGIKHAPVIQARRDIFTSDKDIIKRKIQNGIIVSGFGNSFFKDDIDPSFKELDGLVNELPEYKNILEIQEFIQDHKEIEIYPNAAAYTALVAEYLKLPTPQELWLFLNPRIHAWLSL